MKLASALDEYETAKILEGVSEKTQYLYEYAIGGFGEYLGHNPEISEIERDDIRGYLKHLMEGKGLAKTTVSIHYRTMQAFFNWLVDEGKLEESPMDGMSKPKTADRHPRIISQEQVEQLLDSARKRVDCWSGMRNFSMILTFLETGLRRNELASAKLDDLDLEGRSLKVHGKGAKDRKVFFGKRTQQLLKRWLKVRDSISAEVTSDTLFIDQNGNQLKGRNVYRVTKRMAKRAGLGDVQVSPHVLRHTAATMAVKNGIGPHALKEQFGWSKLSTSMRYVHFVGERLKDEYTTVSPVDNLSANKQSNKRNDHGKWVSE